MSNSFNELLLRGRTITSESSVVIAGLAQNLSSNYKNIRRIIGDISSLFKSYSVILYENDSSDNSPALLNQWKNEDQNFNYISERLNLSHNNKTVNLDRIQHLSSFRNKYMEWIATSSCSTSDFLIVLDTDITDIYLNGLISSFGYGEIWNCITSNGLSNYKDQVVYYDIESLAIGNVVQNDHVRMPFPITQGLIPIRSGFGGLAIYRMCNVVNKRYGLHTINHKGQDIPVVEHIVFNEGLHFIFINPYQVVLR